MPFRCRTCRKRFSVRTGTATADSNLNYRVWAIAIYLLTTKLKGISSMKLHRGLKITQKSAWHLAHQLRQAWAVEQGKFDGPHSFVELLYLRDCIQINSSRAPNCCLSIVSKE